MRDREFLVQRIITSLATLLTTLIIILPMQGQAQGRDSTKACCDFWQPGWMRRHMWGGPDVHPEVQARMQRHRTFMHGGIPTKYQGARSTVLASAANVATGGQLYLAHCTSCHGTDGMGDGDAAKGLSPSPALLAHMIQMPVSVDSYLLWTISEGGQQFGTAMPAFKEKLSEDQIWKIVVYMRAGFPPVRKTP